MSVTIKKCMGRFGNQLFPYFTARIISEHLKFKLYGPSEANSEFMLHSIDLNYNQEGYDHYDSPVQQLGNHSLSDEYCHPDFNILEIINDKTPRKIILDGYFQRKKFYLPFRDQIIKWFNPTFYETNAADIAVHIRLGDLLCPNLKKHLLPPEYYESAISMCPAGKIYICTDYPQHEFIQHMLKKYDASLFQDSEKNTVSFLASHNNLILSQGSFSFWSGFLCNGKNIINAIPRTGWNSSVDDPGVDLLLSGENYKFIKL